VLEADWAQRHDLGLPGVQLVPLRELPGSAAWDVVCASILPAERLAGRGRSASRFSTSELELPAPAPRWTTAAARHHDGRATPCLAQHHLTSPASAAWGRTAGAGGLARSLPRGRAPVSEACTAAVAAACPAGGEVVVVVVV